MSPKLALLCLLAVTASAVVFEDHEYEFLFTKWVQHHQKSYDAENFFYRFGVFKANLDYIYKHNQENHTYTLGMNAFGDLTREEFFSTHLGLNNIKRDYIRSVNEADLDDVEIAESLDWRTEGAVTPIKDQGQCGSCWAFSTTGSTEGAYFLKKGELVSLSEQQLVDCSTSYGNEGCNGGFMDYGFEYIIDNGITDEADYPYKARDQKCSTGKPVKATISSYKDVKAKDSNAFLAAVNIGPLSIAIEADQNGFQFYSSGVFTGTCGVNLDHGVLIVGYGIDGANKYYILKNSWGTSWGEKGYMRIVDKPTLNGGAGQCGMMLNPCYPVV
jgi:cathepsin L